MWLASSSLEAYVHDLLQKYLGGFVHISRDGISFSIWAGEGVLEGVAVRPDALRSWGLHVLRGRAARIRLIVPWHALRSVPVTVRLEGLVIDVEPWSQQGPSPSDWALSEVGDRGGVGGSGGGSISRYFERMAALILANLVFEIEDAVISLEGAHVVGAAAFASGCCGDRELRGSRDAPTVSLTARLRKLTSSPADSGWSPAFLQHEADDTQPTHRSS